MSQIIPIESIMRGLSVQEHDNAITVFTNVRNLSESKVTQLLCTHMCQKLTVMRNELTLTKLNEAKQRVQFDKSVFVTLSDTPL